MEVKGTRAWGGNCQEHTFSTCVCYFLCRYDTTLIPNKPPYLSKKNLPLSTKYWVSCPLEVIEVGEGTVWEARSLIANICIPKTSYRLHILYNCICQNDQHLEKVKTMCSTLELGEIKDKGWNLNHMEQCKKNHQITDTTISNIGYNAKSRGIFDDHISRWRSVQKISVNYIFHVIYLPNVKPIECSINLSHAPC